MKILLVCAAGLSTSILMKKLREICVEQNGIELDIDAVGIGEYQETCANYDVLLLGAAGVLPAQHRQAGER